MTRDERQEINIQRWINAGGRNSIIAQTGYGKTTVATKVIIRYINKNPDAKILVVVPTLTLKRQWKQKLEILNLNKRCIVEVINTVIKHNWDVNIMIVDEVHRAAAPTFRKIFQCVTYNRLLCLTATMERLDGMEKIIEYYAPICDTVTQKECIENGWIAEYQEYKILIDVDLTEYMAIDKDFVKFFGYFSFDLAMAMKAVQFKPYRKLLARQWGVTDKMVDAITFTFARLLHERKSWVINHPKKVEIANRILAARSDKKILTFSASIKQANDLNGGDVIHHEVPIKKRDEIIQNYADAPSGVLHSVDTLKEGLDVPGVSTAILVGYNSSILKKIQTIGRTIRKEGNKKAEIFTLVLRNTVEEQWFNKSSREGNYLTVDEQDLNKILGIETDVHSENSLYID